MSYFGSIAKVLSWPSSTASEDSAPFMTEAEPGTGETSFEPNLKIIEIRVNEADLELSRYRVASIATGITTSDIDSPKFRAAIEEALSAKMTVDLLLNWRNVYSVMDTISGHFDHVTRRSKEDLTKLRKVYTESDRDGKQFDKLVADIQAKLEGEE